MNLAPQELSQIVAADRIVNPQMYRRSFNLAPGTLQPVTLQMPGGQREIHCMKWGLVPHFAKTPGESLKNCNIRCESILSKPYHHDLLQKQRCLVVVSGYYEWQRSNRQPFFLHLPDNEPMILAAVYDKWAPEQGSSTADGNTSPLYTYAIITVDAQPALRRIHNRMPAVLSSTEAMNQWLDCDRITAASASGLLQTLSSPLLARPVSQAVNSVRNQSDACMQPLGKDTTLMSMLRNAAAAKAVDPHSGRSDRKRRASGASGAELPSEERMKVKLHASSQEGSSSSSHPLGSDGIEEIETGSSASSSSGELRSAAMQSSLALRKLTDLGFSETQAREALKKSNASLVDLEKAVDYLVNETFG